jgi:two-component system, NarL family, nitrate/nitrite sensor histidine kinase NarX
MQLVNAQRLTERGGDKPAARLDIAGSRRQERPNHEKLNFEISNHFAAYCVDLGSQSVDFHALSTYTVMTIYCHYYWKKRTCIDMNLFNVVRNRINSHLSTQLLLIIVPTTFILVGLSAWLVHNFVFQKADEITELSLMDTTDTIEDVLQHSFMLNDSEMLQQLVFDIGIQRNANTIRLLNRDSVVLASSIPDETGIPLNRQDPACQNCHTPNSSELLMAEGKSFANSNRGVVWVANGIENRIACQECHKDDGEYLGLILAEFPAEPMRNWHSVFDTGLSFGALLVGIILSGVVYTSLSTKVVQPLKSLIPPSNTENPNLYENEIKHLSRHIRKMEADLGNWQKRLADQHRMIDTIFSLQYNIDEPPTIEKFFRRTLESVKKVTGYQAITMRLYDSRTQSFRVMAQSGMSPAMLRDLEIIPSDAGFHGEVIQSHMPAFTSKMSIDPRMTSAAPIQEGYESLVCIPMLALDELVGTIQIALKEEHFWDEDELRWLALIGRRIGLLIHQIQLTERLRDLAVLEERSRIAQEIHDGLAQLIGSLRLWSEEALISLEEGNPSAARKTLQKIESAARDAYASLRDEMLGLRETILPSKDLPAVVNEYLNRFQRQWGIHTQLHLQEKAQSLQAWPISPAAEIQLLRIIQEGMTNVRRHANASLILVTLSTTNGYLKVLIQDDGIGFDLEYIPEDRLGMRIMRERAASVGGTISISSNFGKGTELMINIPMRTSQNIQKGGL